ncbi:hypothetical protein FOXB_16764, partial [Fusarium oxysporum f. sp. conglutinans Fo5176]
SDESLPPSPMMPLMVDDESPLSDRVPMGYNLGHDLGDFLKWQEENIVVIETSPSLFAVFPRSHHCLEP